MNQLPSIGIIGGAGPEAGGLLFQQIIRICQTKFSCERDYDFPLIQLLSYPFSEMLGENPDREEILSQLKFAYNSLKADYIVVACNTLHTFIDDSFQPPKFIHMIEETRSNLSGVPLVLCSTTSKKARIHERFFPCAYPGEKAQKEVDAIIDSVLAGNPLEPLSKHIASVIKNENKGDASLDIVLGCTELSIIHNHSPIDAKGFRFIDPSMTVANKLCELAFRVRPRSP